MLVKWAPDRPSLEPMLSYCSLGNKSRGNLSQITKILFQEDACEYIVCKIGASLSRTQCGKKTPNLSIIDPLWGEFIGDRCPLIGGFRPHHDDVVKWKHFPRHWPFVRGIHRSPVNSPHKGLWRGALRVFYLRLNKRLNKQWCGWWFETLSCPLWRHCNVWLMMRRAFPCHILYVTSSYSTWIFCREVSCLATDCPCGVWCRGLTTCLLHVGPPFGNRILNNSWAVGLT